MALSMVSTAAFAADELPGKGVKVQPLKSSIAEETFQTLLVMKALKSWATTCSP
jgi:glycine betaine/proline transport system substrate-binding protein